MRIDLHCGRNWETLNRWWYRRRTSVITYPCYRRSQAYMCAMLESVNSLAAEEDIIFERPTSIWTASTVFSSPCRSKEADALCNRRPNRCRTAVIYWCRGSLGLVRANPAFTGPMMAIISGISFLMLVRCNTWHPLKLLTKHHWTCWLGSNPLGWLMTALASECQKTRYEQSSDT